MTAPDLPESGPLAVSEAPATFEPEAIGSPMRRGITEVLRVGVLAAVTLLLIGGILLYTLQGPGRVPRGLGSGFGIALESGSPSAFLYLGALVLVATPLVRVVLTTVLFARGRDTAFTVITLVVLATLLITVGVGSRL